MTTGVRAGSRPIEMTTVALTEHIVDIVSDSGEGAQKCGQSFAAIAARMGYEIWTVEIIPAEIQPPARSVAGASGNRTRLASRPVGNGGDAADLVVAFNEQVLLGRIEAGEVKPGGIILIEGMWRNHQDSQIAASFTRACDRLLADGYRVYEIPMERQCLEFASGTRRGKNMFALGLLCRIYHLDLDLALEQVASAFATKGDGVIDLNQQLLRAGWEWADVNLDLSFVIPATPPREPRVVINGNGATALGIMASGMEVCAMYPITPATSASHYLSEIFEKVGGVVHQAEDEIAACAFAIGASYAGKCAVTITSGPGYSLKQENIGLAVMAEIPLVIVDVQRGGPSTGQPTKAEQGDLLTAVFGSHGDAPKVVMGVADIEDCFYSIITARRIAETFNMVVVVLSDASLATAQQPFARPVFSRNWLAPPIDQTPIPDGALPYDWEPVTGLIRRFSPGQPKGMHCITGLAHDRSSTVAYDPAINQEGIRSRSMKLAAFQRTLRPVEVTGDQEGELLVVGWGSTKGAIEEAVERLRTDGHRVGALHLRFLQPLAPGIKQVMERYRRVVAVENNYCDVIGDGVIDEENRRFTNLAWLLRARTLVDIDCWGEVRGQPLKPATIEMALREKLA